MYIQLNDTMRIITDTIRSTYWPPVVSHIPPIDILRRGHKKFSANQIPVHEDLRDLKPPALKSRHPTQTQPEIVGF